MSDQMNLSIQGQSKNIGILTLPLNRNIGGNLQAYALTQAIRDIGYEPILINRRHYSDNVEKKQTDGLADNLYSNTIGMKKSNPNGDFLDKNLGLISRQFYSSDELAECTPSYNFYAVIVGSDQIWRLKYARGVLPDLYLDFLGTNQSIKRISYAASFGSSRWEYNEHETSDAARLLNSFHAVSVREDSGVTLCKKHLNKSATHVLDPTMLLTANHYILKFALDSRRVGGGRLLTYILDIDSNKAEVVSNIAEKLSLKPYLTSGEPFVFPLLDNGAAGDKTVEGWLSSLYQASFVLTDSFHGTVFSILFNKPFIAYGNPSRGMARFTSLLKMFGLESRLVTKTTPLNIDQMLEPINWNVVNKRLEYFRSESFQFLDKALSEQPIETRRVSTIERIIQESKRVQSAEIGSCSNPLNVLCSGCGVCVSESRGTLKMAWNEDGFLAPKAIKPNIPESAVKVCPFNTNPDAVVKDEDAIAEILFPDSKFSDPRAGRFENCYVGYSREFRPTSSSGGIATYVLEQLLLRGIVQYLYVVKTDDHNGYKYAVCSSAEDVRSISKTRYYPVSMDDLFSIIDQSAGRVAVSGVACFIKAIRLKQHYCPEYRQKIAFTVGIICGGLKSKFYTDYLAQGAGVKGGYTNPEYRIKEVKSTASDYSFSATDTQGKVHVVKMRTIGNSWGAGYFKAKACDFCTDVLTELADISVGDAWLQNYRLDGMGNSIVLARSTLADNIIRNGIENGDLVMDEVSVGLIARSQNGGFNHKHGGLSYRVWAATFFSRIPIPHVRQRLLNPMDISQAIVQVHRERTRSKSIKYWKESQDFSVFNRRMQKSKLALDAASAARKDGSNDFLLAFLNNRIMSSSFFLDNQSTHEQNLLKRWILSLFRGQQFYFGLIRAALFNSGVLSTLDETTKDASARLK
jgi:coenzyme F420-reducing hydrogenase beta subunit